VDISDYKDTVEDYAKLIEQQFKDHKKDLIKQEKTDTEFSFEYMEMGTEPGGNRVQTHTVARAVLTPGRVYLVRGTTPDTNWMALSGKLMDCVKGFEMDKTEAGKSNIPPSNFAPQRHEDTKNGNR
jgi:hypothetical protein